MADRGTIRAHVMRSVHPWLVALVGTRAADEVFAHAGIAIDAPSTDDARISFDAGVALLEEAARISGRHDAAVLYAAQLPWAHLGVLGYVLQNAPTIGAAIAHLRRYFAIQQQAGSFALDIDDGRARLSYMLRAAPHEPARQHALAVLAMTTRLVRDGLNDPRWSPDEVTISHPATDPDARDFFRTAITYDAPVASIAFPAELLRRAMVHADADLLPILVEHADERLAQLGPVEDDLLARLRTTIAGSLDRDTLAIDDIAGVLGMSARSVQRHLQSAGLSFKQLVDEIRLSIAKRHLADPDLTLTDAAFLLGYSDLSAFSRAFRRWTGRSPQDYRRDPR